MKRKNEPSEQRPPKFRVKSHQFIELVLPEGAIGYSGKPYDVYRNLQPNEARVLADLLLRSAEEIEG